MRRLHFILALALSFASLHAFAQRTPVPVVDLENIPVTSSTGRALTAAETKQAVLAGAAAKQWEVKEDAPGSALATLHVRGKHTVVVGVTWTPGNVSFKYRDSTNMKFGQLNGKNVIHPFYNRWVEDLKEGVRLAALKV